MKGTWWIQLKDQPENAEFKNTDQRFLRLGFLPGTTIMPDEDTSNNALGLDFADKSDSHALLELSPDLNTVKKEKEKPYVNSERVKTGGAQRVRSTLFLSFFSSNFTQI